MRRDEQLVGRDDRLAGLQRSPDQISRRLETAHQLDDDVGVGGDDTVDAVGPINSGRYPVDLLALHSAIANGRQLQRWMNPARQHLRHGPPDRAESDDGDSSGALRYRAQPARREAYSTLLLTHLFISAPQPSALSPQFWPGLMVTGSRNGIMPLSCAPTCSI